MTTGIRDFCKNYLEKLVNDKLIKEHQEEVKHSMKYERFKDLDHLDRITFTLHISKYTPGVHFIGNRSIELLVLDEDDLEYLYAKYHKRVSIELAENIAELKKDYDEDNNQ